jgi:hypothetical protein
VVGYGIPLAVDQTEVSEEEVFWISQIEAVFFGTGDAPVKSSVTNLSRLNQRANWLNGNAPF